MTKINWKMSKWNNKKEIDYTDIYNFKASAVKMYLQRGGIFHPNKIVKLIERVYNEYGTTCYIQVSERLFEVSNFNNWLSSKEIKGEC